MTSRAVIRTTSMANNSLRDDSRPPYPTECRTVMVVAIRARELETDSFPVGSFRLITNRSIDSRRRLLKRRKTTVLIPLRNIQTCTDM
ncbi:hypothetical protein PMAYCL1PPCAC_30324 [Pristionchus mayeri]|uniref:Uncharacterized protein n=1 Tax=Pristionchus mayeri TaxID=1317129 RepID=A0AAN5DDZ4_9BILA|nr:hypothetical protein PMAYCL1PPCAC_30324 [Pristionchus mayeri]